MACGRILCNGSGICKDARSLKGQSPRLNMLAQQESPPHPMPHPKPHPQPAAQGRRCAESSVCSVTEFNCSMPLECCNIMMRIEVLRV
eukprot:4119937-Amphidinium_carterae.2